MDKNHAESIAISKILDKLQIKPLHIGKSKALYRSLISKEKHPSFWVYFKTNTWYDYGISAGGDLNELVWRYLKSTGEAYTPVDVQRWIANMSSDRLSSEQIDQTIFAISKADGHALTVKSVEQIRFIGLIKYLEGLGIPVSLANRYAKELRIYNHKTGKTFIAIGIANEDGAYELRNPFFNGFIQPRGISFFRGMHPPSRGIHVFKDVFDFLSVLSQLNCQAWEHDTIVLHSSSNAAFAAPYVQHYGYKTMYSWMDNDAAGHRATSILYGFVKNQPGLVHLKMNRVYEEFPSVNAWHVSTRAKKTALGSS